MRVIAGSARSLRLKTLDGMDTRPTTDRIKETLFNMISPELADCRFLDLFSGSGAIGIEALSRGARTAYFVEKNQKAAACIRDNLKHTRLEDRAVLMKTDVISALRKMEGEAPFDFIFMDPPYESMLEEPVLGALERADYVTGETLIVMEAPLTRDFSFVRGYDFEIVREKHYKTNKHVFIKRRG